MIPTNENFGLDKLKYLKFEILNYLPIRKKQSKTYLVKQLAIIESWRCSAGTAACWLFTVHSNVHLSYRSKLQKCIIFLKCWLVNLVPQFIKVIHHQWWDINLWMSHNRFFPSDRSRASIFALRSKFHSPLS